IRPLDGHHADAEVARDTVGRSLPAGGEVGAAKPRRVGTSIRAPHAIAEPGSGLSQLKCDCFDDGVEVLIDLTQHDAHHPPALRLHPKVAVDVVSLDVRFAVDLHDQAGFWAHEVGQVLTDRMLAAKLHAEPLTTQSLPDPPLGGGHVSTK